MCNVVWSRSYFLYVASAAKHMKPCLSYFSSNYNYRNISVSEILSYLIIVKIVATVTPNMGWVWNGSISENGPHDQGYNFAKFHACITKITICSYSKLPQCAISLRCHIIILFYDVLPGCHIVSLFYDITICCVNIILSRNRVSISHLPVSCCATSKID